MQKILVIANSARILTQAAYNIGIQTIAIDCFSDKDMQDFALQSYQVKSLSLLDIQSIVLSVKSEIHFCIYGSGFEAYPDSLSFIARHFKLLGNSPEVFKALLDKERFFYNLKNLEISFPKTYFPNLNDATPIFGFNDKKKYLFKPFNSQGGLNIFWINSYDKTKLNGYYQQYLQGESLSALFVADGKQARIIGFNSQWSTSLESQDFIFLGIRNGIVLTEQQQKKLFDWILKLTKLYGLLGLCSLDFILYKDKCYVLEINPRPPASMQLYDKNLLQYHLLAHKENNTLQNIDVIEKHSVYTAYQIIYAPKAIKISPNIKWSEYCYDLPSENIFIPKGQPICSIIASHKNLKHLLQTLQDRQQLILNQLFETNYE